MNQKHRLMCESWVEKRPEVNYVTSSGTASSKQSIKWKTRYAMLVVSSETRLSEVRFYQKKPRSCTEITDDIIKLQPWQYIVDIPSWIVDKGRPHVLRLRLLPESVIPGQHFRLQIAYQSSEEATAWMRCIQNQTKLTSGIQGHSFGVVAEECSATARIGVAGKHCLLFVSPTQTDRSVVCVWPFEAIRSYASDDDRRLVIEAGRCAPLGEGVYSFRTRENDDNVLFDLFDHYTTTATVEPPISQSKSKNSIIESSASSSNQTKSEPILSLRSGKNRKGHKLINRKGSEATPLIPSSPSSSNTLEYDEPPQKPPLPAVRTPLATLPCTASPVLPLKTAPTKNSVSKANPALTTGPNMKATGTKKNNSTSRGLYELDKLLYVLEGEMKSCRESALKSEADLEYSRPKSTSVLDKVETNSSKIEGSICSDQSALQRSPSSIPDFSIIPKNPTVPYAKINSRTKKSS